MIVREVRLENVKSYGSPAEIIRFTHGVNAICGPNGAGKSTILEAIGCVLFQHLPYRQEEFVREGVNSGTITIVVESRLDRRTYEVVRRVGRGSTQHVYDPDISQTVARGEADVRRWLHLHLRLDAEVDLRSLFLDSVGPPQGTLTAVFLEAAQERKSKFSRLLRVDEYEDAYRKLSALDSALNDEQHDEEVTIAGLGPLARARSALETQREEVRNQQYAQVKDLQRYFAERAAVDQAIEELGRVEQELRTARGSLELALQQQRAADERLTRAQTDHQRARSAHETCARTRSGHDQYLEAVERLRSLEDDQRRRDELLKQRHDAELALQGTTGRLNRLDEEIARAERSASDAAELRKKIPGQEAAERRLELARDAKTKVDEICKRLPGLEARLARANARVKHSETSVANALALHPIADELPARRLNHERCADALADVNRAEGELKGLRESIAHTRQQIDRLQMEATSLDQRVATLTPMEPEVAQIEALEAAHRETADNRAAASAHLRDSKATRAQVAGGLCPFLHETCRNLRPGVTLETHFDGEIRRWTGELSRLDQRFRELDQKLGGVREARARVATLPEIRARRARLEGELSDEAARLSESQEKLTRVARLATQRTELERSTQAALRLVKEAERAALEVSRLSTLRSDLDEARRDQEALESELTGARAQMGELEPIVADLAAAVALLNALNSPRERVAQLEAEAGKIEGLQTQRRKTALEADRAAAQLAETDRSLDPFQSLDRRLEILRERRDRSHADHKEFTAAFALAETLDDHVAALAHAESSAATARNAITRCQQAVAAAASAYDGEAHQRAQRRRDELVEAIGHAQGRIKKADDDLEDLEQKITEALGYERDLDAHRRQIERIDDERRLAATLRQSIRAAGPEITRQLLSRISRMATRINAEVLNQSGIELEWTPDYEIITRRGGETRGFAQLSGGEQMAAALAVRLAILRDLSNVRMAFLDEPTAHLDQERRANLGDQVQRLQGFDQLVVISHDDTFDGLFGHVIRIGRENGRSRVLDQN